MRSLSLCSGYGGLDLAVEAATGAQTAAFAEFDKSAASIFERHWPGVPNLGDINAIGWDELGPVDVLTAGYPCQPFSHAGQRKGEHDDRHLWPAICEGIRTVRPRLVVLENVAGHLSMGADRVVGDLAEARYCVRWTCLRAADVGAPHGRLRVFIVATDTEGVGRAARWSEPDGGRTATSRQATSPADADDRGSRDGRAEPARGSVREEPAADADGGGRQEQPEQHRQQAQDPTDGHPRGGHPHGRRDEAPTDAPVECGSSVQGEPDAGRPLVGTVAGAGGGVGAGHPAAGVRGLDGGERLAWGDYEPAIRRWEHTLGRPAPAPTDERGRLAPRFVEWMMGLPDGWVTGLMRPNVDPRPNHISRNQALKALGNGVVPQQAYAAITSLLEPREVAA